eukprot:124622-Prymnesium_polylepis.3
MQPSTWILAPVETRKPPALSLAVQRSTIALRTVTFPVRATLTPPPMSARQSEITVPFKLSTPTLKTAPPCHAEQLEIEPPFVNRNEGTPIEGSRNEQHAPEYVLALQSLIAVSRRVTTDGL